jgi:Tfp pilus assembly protein FimT
MVGFTYSGFSGVIQRQRSIAAVNRVVLLLKEAQSLAKEKHTICYVTVGTDSNGTFDMTLDSDYTADTTAQSNDTIVREVKISKQYQKVTVQSGATLRFDYRGVPLATAFPVTISLLNARAPSSGNATITVSSMGEIIATLPNAWK